MEAFCLKIVFSYLELCGFCHFSHTLEDIPKKTRRISIIMAYIHLALLSSIVVATIYYAENIFIMSDMVSAATDILKFGLPVVSQYVIIAESIKTRNIRHRFWKRIIHLDKSPLNTPPEYIQQHINRFIFKGALLLVSTITIELFIIFRVSKIKVWQNHVLITFYTYFMCQSQVLFCVFFIETLKCRMDLLMMQLEGMRYKIKCLNYMSLMRAKKSYGIMWQALNDINQSFGLCKIPLSNISLFFFFFFSSLKNFFADCKIR